MRVSWEEFKTFIAKVSVTYHEKLLDDNNLLLQAVDGNSKLERTCKLRDDTDEMTEYNTSYKANANKAIGATEVSGIQEPKAYRARLKGIISGTAIKNTVTNLDYQMEQLAWLGSNKVGYFDGVDFYAQDGIVGDAVSFQVVDKDGLVYPAGTVLEEFASNWNIVPGIKDTIRLFKSKIYPGFYIRVVYTSVGTVNDVKFVCNLFRFIKTDEDA